MRAAKRPTVGFLAFILTTASLILGGTSAAHASVGHVQLRASVDGRDLAKVDANKPLRLRPNLPLALHVEVDNQSANPLDIHGVRLEGKVIGIAFFSYETVVDVPVAPHESVARDFQFELIDLDHQASGLLPARVVLLDVHRSVVASVGLPVDVRGSARSLYSLFGLAVMLITAVVLASALLRLVSHRLESNRWSRGCRFGVAGLGLGFTLTFALSAFRVVSPVPGSWIPIVLVSTAVLFVFGYLTPTPDTRPAGDERAGTDWDHERVVDLDGQGADIRERDPRSATAESESPVSTLRRAAPPAPPV